MAKALWGKGISGSSSVKEHVVIIDKPLSGRVRKTGFGSIDCCKHRLQSAVIHELGGTCQETRQSRGL